MPSRTLAIAILALGLTPGASAIQLLPAGEFRARDGRPEGLPGFRLDELAAQRLIARTKSRRLVIDYEHQTLHAEKNGQAAPAAGWITALEWRAGQGLYATVEWTQRARDMIAAGEYRFISPVIGYDKRTGEVVDLIMAAITNVPAIEGMDEVTLRAAARFAFSEDTVDRTKLIAVLGLKAEATDADIDAALAALNAAAKKTGGLESEIAALKQAASGAPDPAKYVPVEVVTQLQTQLAALTTQVASREVDEIVRAALTAGKLLPAQEPWARELGGKDLAALRAYVEKTPAIAALAGTQTGGKKPADDPEGAGLSEAELAVCRNMGLTGKQFREAQAA